MKRTHLLLIAILLLCAAGAAVFWHRGRPASSRAPASPGSPPVAESPGQTVPPFSLKDIHGNAVSSAQFAGKPLVINFFATWCPPCRQEIPGFVDIHEKYRAKGFELVGISLDPVDRANLPRLIDENRIGYRILLGDAATARAFGGVQSIPTTLFVGKDGRVRNVHVGYMDRDTFEIEVRKLL